jgi:dTDP-4-dehydrorhamnose reductase
VRRALILGCGGQLGSVLTAARWPRGWRVRGLDRLQLDVTDPVLTRQAIARADPDLVVNAAACTDVDGAEQDPDSAYAVNRDGAAFVAEACACRHVPLIHISSSDVFDGELGRAWGEADPVSPINICGASNAAGENEVRRRLETHVILRTSWLFGATGSGVLRNVLTLGAERSVLRVVAGETARPTAAHDLAAAVIAVAERLVGGVPAWGTYHFANAGEASRASFTEAILRLAGLPTRVEAVAAAEARPALRPGNAVLDCSLIARVYGLTPRPWQKALAELLPLAAPGRQREIVNKG